MPNKLAIIVDHYFELRGEDPNNYTRHLRAAKDLLVLCDGDTDKACKALDRTHDFVNGFGDEWYIDTAVKKYYELKSKVVDN